MKLKWWLVILLSLIVGLMGYQLTNKANRWEASAIYTVAPKISPEGAPSGWTAYTDIQAANLFIDVARSWLLSDAVRSELNQKFDSSRLSDLPHRSMQTFDLQVIGPTADSAEQGLLWADGWLRQELTRYNQSSQMTQYSIYSGETTEKQIKPRPDLNGLLAGLIALIVSLLITLSINYYRQAYAHRS